MNKLDNKGQSLVIFVIFIPLFIMIGTFIIDIGFAKYNERKLNSISKEVISYGMKHISDDPRSEMEELIKKNDDEITYYEIDIDTDNNKIKLIINKDSKGIFGKIIGKELYKIRCSYIGFIEDENIVIEKSDEK